MRPILDRTGRFVDRVQGESGFLWRRATSCFRSQPDTLIIGAQKSGTSSLFAYMVQHPFIKGSYRKEVHYFDGGLTVGNDNFKKHDSWYRAHFPLQKREPIRSRTLEATPSYMFVPEAAGRIRNSLGKIKILILLRNPVDRAISNYFHEIKAGREKRSIRDALCVPDIYDIEQFPIGSAGYINALHFSYRTRGVYAPQVARYFKYFGEENVLVLGSNELFSFPRRALERVFSFLGLEENLEIGDLSPRNVNSEKRIAPRSVISCLETFFADYNDELFELLGVDVDW